MQWNKKGLLYITEGKHEWSRSHAGAPFVLPIEKECIRVYFSTRDAMRRSHITWVEYGINGYQLELLRVADRPSLIPGKLGCFDDSGAMGSCIVKTDKEFRLYYTGWNLGVTVPLRFSIGFGTSIDGNIFERMSDGPLMDRNPVDPYLVASPCVIFDHGMWHMWYVSAERWEQKPNELMHYYHVRYAWSINGIEWNREGKVCIDFKNNAEYAIARPSVIIENGTYKMWYCYRASQQAETYRIGYAESPDGIDWIRMDAQAGIDVSSSGWDSEMICYPWVFKVNEKLFMLYNGNDYGRTGFGYAVADVDE